MPCTSSSWPFWQIITKLWRKKNIFLTWETFLLVVSFSYNSECLIKNLYVQLLHFKWEINKSCLLRFGCHCGSLIRPFLQELLPFFIKNISSEVIWGGGVQLELWNYSQDVLTMISKQYIIYLLEDILFCSRPIHQLLWEERVPCTDRIWPEKDHRH